ncbi:GL23829 [Drosophila persimilis]|nr:GL23829 [Drosophila persimilis]
MTTTTSARVSCGHCQSALPVSFHCFATNCCHEQEQEQKQQQQSLRSPARLGFTFTCLSRLSAGRRLLEEIVGERLDLDLCPCPFSCSGMFICTQTDTPPVAQDGDEQEHKEREEREEEEKERLSWLLSGQCVQMLCEPLITRFHEYISQ